MVRGLVAGGRYWRPTRLYDWRLYFAQTVDDTVRFALKSCKASVDLLCPNARSTSPKNQLHQRYLKYGLNV